nr:hypothetical protein [Tanacetum cinerariifolium]
MRLGITIGINDTVPKG